MTPTTLPATERARQEDDLLATLLALYSEEAGIYREVRELSRRQSELVRRGGSLQEMHSLLLAKREQLEAIAQLEQEHAAARTLWEAGRDRWSGSGVARLQTALREVGAVLEEILALETENDRLLLASVGA